MIEIDNSSLVLVSTGDLDKVYTGTFNGEKVIQKQFMRNDTYSLERYKREKYLYRILFSLGLSPELIDFDDSSLQLLIRYFPHKKATNKREVVEQIGRSFQALKVFHGIETRSLNDDFEISLTVTGEGRKEALNRILGRYAGLPCYTDYSGVMKDLAFHVADKSFDFEEKTLLHGDLHPLNVLINNDKINFIDFGRSRIGNPEFDVGYYIYWTTNGYKFDFSPSETRSLLESAVSAYGGNERFFKRSQTYYYLFLADSLPWLEFDWPVIDGSKKDVARKIAKTNYSKLIMGARNGFVLK